MGNESEYVELHVQNKASDGSVDHISANLDGLHGPGVSLEIDVKIRSRIRVRV